MGIIYALGYSLITGLGNIFLKKSSQNVPPTYPFLLLSLFSFFLWGAVGLWFGVDFTQVFLGLGVGLICSVFGQLIYIYVISRGELSITATILSGFSLFTILFSIAFNNEKIQPLMGIFISLAIVGTIIVTLPHQGKFNKNDLYRLDGILWALFGAIAIGASDTLTKWYINKTSVGSFLFYTAFIQVIVSYCYFALKKENIHDFIRVFKQMNTFKYLIIGSFCLCVSTLFLFLAFGASLASIVSPIAASYPVLTTVFALFLLNEKISLKNSIGLIFLFIAVIGIGFIGG